MPPVADDLSSGDIQTLFEENSAESWQDPADSNDAVDPTAPTAPIDPSDLEPIDPIARPDYPHINWVLSNLVPLE